MHQVTPVMHVPVVNNVHNTYNRKPIKCTGYNKLVQDNNINTDLNYNGSETTRPQRLQKVEKHKPNADEQVKSIKTVYCNVNGLAKKTNDYFTTLLHDNNIDILAVCEHKKNRKHDLPIFTNYV